tara:strand:- start:355 stop:600 length:246 start_codon:yes stop_codon:yes gene_type:complete
VGPLRRVGELRQAVTLNDAPVNAWGRLLYFFVKLLRSLNMKFDKFYDPSPSMLTGYSRHHHSFGEVAILAIAVGMLGMAIF